MTTPKRPLWFALSTFLLAFALSACQTSGPTTAGNSSQTLAPSASAPATAPAPAQASGPTFGNPSPTAGSSTSEKANAAADAAAYKEVEYKNIKKKGPALIVIPGEIKSSNASFTRDDDECRAFFLDVLVLHLFIGGGISGSVGLL